MTITVYPREQLNEPWFREAVQQDQLMWNERIEAYLRTNGDKGTCVLGAGIHVYVGSAQNPKRHTVLEPLPRVQGASVWEESKDDVIAFLATRGIEAHYNPGAMD